MEDRGGRRPVKAGDELGKLIDKLVDMDERERDRTAPDQPAFVCARCRKPGHRRRQPSDAKSECRNHDCKFSKRHLDK